MAGNIPYTRAFVQLINSEIILEQTDFATQEYLATKNFFTELSSMQQQIIKGEKVTLGTGSVIDMNSTGGLIALNLYMEALDQSKQAMLGLSRLGLKTENAIWSKHQN
jgi:hypothetical protein